MKKHVFLLSVLVMLGAGCNSSTQMTNTNQAPAVENPQPTPVTTVTPTSTKMTVTITQLTPASGKTGMTVTIAGQGFTKTDNQIMFGTSSNRHHLDGTADNVIVTEDSADGTTLTFVVPTSGPSGILCSAQNACVGIAAMLTQPGEYMVAVANANGVSNKTTFTVTKK